MYTNNVEFEITNGAVVELVGANGSIVKVKGSKGELEKNFGLNIELKKDGNKIKVSAKEKAMLNTIRGIINNMAVGVQEGYTRKMKVNYAHFPMSLEIKGNIVFIKNFIGEKHPRKSKIVGEVKVSIKGQEVTITGLDKEHVSQTVANLRMATKIKDKDPRIFQDGIYPINQ